MISGRPYKLDNLSEYLGNDKNQIKEMIQLFIDTIPPDVDQIIEFSKQNEWQEVYKLAHRIKPTFEVFQMDDLFREIKTIEMIARNNNQDNNLNIHLDRFVVGFKLVLGMLEYEVSE